MTVERHEDHRVLRFEVPVNDQWNTVKCEPGRLLHVASRDASKVEFWQEVWLNDPEPGDGPSYERTFIVIGTGHPIPIGATWRGTCLTSAGALVWHLYEKGR